MPMLQVGTEAHKPVEIHYQDHGSGKPVVLIHGWPLSGRSWEAQVPALIAAGYRAPSPTTAAVSASLPSPGRATTTTRLRPTCTA